MCGIFYSQNLNVPRSCIDLVSYRGPDASSWQKIKVNNTVLQLGHRRLKIIDPSDAANQPMRSRDQRYLILYNGMIFNFIELRAKLTSLGHVFETNSDTEVLLNSWAEWGINSLHKFQGMFAGVIIDLEKKRAIAFRDPFGIKPLYWVKHEDGFAIASEIKQFFQIPGFLSEGNPKAIHDFLIAGVSDYGSETFFSRVNRLPAGHYIDVQIATESTSVKAKRWYKPPTKIIKEPFKRHIGLFKNKLANSIDTHLRSDAPIGFYLSGGLDSSTIITLAAKSTVTNNSELHTYTATVEHPKLNEKRWAKIVANSVAADANWVTPKIENFDKEYRKLTWHMDEPIASASPFAQWFVNKAVKKSSIHVMLDGQGADEVLAGYHSIYLNYYIELLRQFNVIGVIGLLIKRRVFSKQNDISVLKSAVALYLRQSPFSPMIRTYWRRKTRAKNPWPWLNRSFLRSQASSEELGGVDIMGHPHARDVIDQCRFLTFDGSLPKLLRYQDRSSMAHSIEARLPFLDIEVAEYALSLPRALRIKGTNTKYILRQAMRTELPEEIRNRKDKIGFAMPLPLQISDDLKAAVRQYCKTAVTRFPQIFEADNTIDLVERVLSGTATHADENTVWRITSLGCWSEVFDI